MLTGHAKGTIRQESPEYMQALYKIKMVEQSKMKKI